MTVRSFRCDDLEWVAWSSGTGAYGTGVWGLGNVEAIHFARADAADVPVFEALVAAGGFDGLFDEELLRIFREARPVVDPATIADRPVSRRGEGLS